MSRRKDSRGQTLVLLALTLLVVTLMAVMTISITMRIRDRLELQTVADTAAYSNAVVAARSFNALALTNRAIVSHWVVALGIQANVAWGSTVPAYFDALASAAEEMRWKRGWECGPPTHPKERQRQKELLAVRNAFNHASLSLWGGRGISGDNVQNPGCTGRNCWKRMKTGLGKLDIRVTRQLQQVRHAIRDLAEVQKHVHRDLEATLSELTLSKRIVALANGSTNGQGGEFPYQVLKGAAPLMPGVAGRTPGWREVSSAIGTTREATQPLVHAVMGSRGSRFVMSGSYAKGEHYHRVTPRRARIFKTKIKRVLNRRFGARTFDFSVKAGLVATYLEGKADLDDYNTMDVDQYYDFFEDLEGDASGDIVEDSDPPVEPPDVYQVNKVNRVTPYRSLGWDYVTSRAMGSAALQYRSPCGFHQLRRNIESAARAHAKEALSRSQHQWRSGYQEITVEDTPDGPRERRFERSWIHHGEEINAYTGEERPSHRPGMMCHPTHKHYGEIADREHAVGDVIDGLGVAPGGVGFVFPQNREASGAAVLGQDGAEGAFGQPKLPVLISKQLSGGGLVKDPWNLTVNFSFTGGAGTTFDMAKEGAPDRMAALATGIAYYHRRCERHQNPRPDRSGRLPRANPRGCRSWKEPPNMLNPFWRATLVPITIDESTRRRVDQTPGVRRKNEAPKMLRAEGLTRAARTYVLLKREGYEGVQ